MKAYVLVQIEADDAEHTRIRVGSIRKAIHGMAESFGYEKQVADMPFYEDEERTYVGTLSSYPALDKEFERHRKVWRGVKGQR